MRGLFRDSNLRPVASAKLNAAFTVPNNAETAITWSAMELAIGDWALLSNGNLVVPEDGVYVAHAGIAFVANVTGTRALFIYGAGVSIAQSGGAQVTTTAGVGAQLTALSKPARLKRGDLVSATSYQNSGGNLDIGSGPASFLAAWRIG